MPRSLDFRRSPIPWSLLVLAALNAGCGDDAKTEPCPDGDTDCICAMTPDASVCSDPCAEDPTAPGCPCAEDPTAPGCPCAEDPTAPGCPDPCETDPDLPRCATCEDDISLPGCELDEETFDGLAGEVEILRDGMGVQHVYASTDADVAYGAGYAQAVGRLFQMDLTRRRAYGRRAEILGEGFVDDDALVRHVNIPGLSRLTAQKVREDHPGAWDLAVAWTAGVNARIDEVLAGEAPMPYGFEHLGYEPERWKAVDMITVAKLLLFGNANQIEFDLLATVVREYAPELWETLPIAMPLTDSFILPPDERPDSRMGLSAPAAGGPARPVPPDAAERIRQFLERMRGIRSGGSNNWVIGGEHTANGRPLICNDPHQPLRSPSLFWPHHMNSADAGGTLDVAGFSFVGTALVQLGHNRDVAWAATTNFADTMDLWSVAVDGDTVTVGDETAPILRDTQEIVVAEGENVTIDVELVPGYGALLPADLSPLPIVDPGRRILFNWPGFRATNEVEAFLAFNRAETHEDVTSNADGFHIGAFNFMAADQDGFSYRAGHLVPDRGDPAEMTTPPYQVLDGDDPSTFWTGEMLPSALMPHSSGGSRGWIASANEDPFGFTADGDVTNDPYYFSAFNDPGSRSKRLQDEIARMVGGGGVTVEQMKTLQTDTHQVFADRLIPMLAEAWAASETDDTLSEYRTEEALRVLELVTDEWDRKMERDSAGALAFHFLMYFAAAETFSDDLSFLFDPLVGASSVKLLAWTVLSLEEAFDGASTFLQQGRDAILLRALERTVELLTTRYGGVDPATFGYTWGDFHGTRFRSNVGAMLDGGWVSTDGGSGTVNVSGDSPFGGDGIKERLGSGGGPIFRAVTSFRDDGTPVTEVNFPRGVSGEPDSPLWDNTLDDWVGDVYRPLAFDRAEVEADLMETITLSP